MAEVSVLYFDVGGAENTDATLKAAGKRAAELGIQQLVVASNTGNTALRAAEIVPDMERIVAVTLQAGLWEVYSLPNPEVVSKAEARGVRFLTCTHSLMGAVASAIHRQFGGLPSEELIARTYYTFSQGTKVAIECMMMAADAGLLDMSQDVISVAGTHGGADTALVVRPTFTHNFFSCRVREVLAMPRTDAPEPE